MKAPPAADAAEGASFNNAVPLACGHRGVLFEHLFERLCSIHSESRFRRRDDAIYVQQLKLS